MKNIDKAKQIVDSNVDTLSSWLQKAREVREIQPYVQQAYESSMSDRQQKHLCGNTYFKMN